MLLKDLIRIPEHVGDQDFVLKLTDGVVGDGAKRALADYVITPQLAKRFDEALGLIKATLGLSEGPGGTLHQGPHQKGRAVYLHGSFGSGKSHFMAVLHRLLTGEKDVLARPELASVVAKHGDWLGQKKFLLVPYHMLGANSLEERVYDGYVRVIGREHPGAQAPALFDTDAVVRNAEGLRGKLGDETFLGLLGDASEDDGWGDYGGGGGAWTLESYLEARDAPPFSQRRQDLATALIERVFPHNAGQSKTVEFPQGLELMTQHAQGLGYDGLVLFLDELILWLASRASTPGFIEAQADKLVNLVESDRMQRPIPIISFIARQRDLRSLIQRGVPGAEQLDIDDKLSHHEGRFVEIKLETTDLPEIASKRLLKPKDDDGRQAIDAAFRDLAGGKEAVRGTLLGERYTIDDFRKVYPFSPVLVDVLVRASTMLQRDRTALRAMLQLLVERRSNLDVGEVIPVGDLYDVISRGNDAVSGTFKEAFERARSLYEGKLEPLLEESHGMRRHEIEQLDWDDPKRKEWRADDRILKTLLLGSLVSGVPALEALDAKRIAHLNHGSIRTRIPGQEGATVLRKLRQWANRVPEIRITGDETNPTIQLELHGVDVEGVVRNAQDYDNHGNRVALIRQLLLESLGLKESKDGLTTDVVWRGTRRSAEVLIANVANLPLASLENDGEEWKVIVDYPIDELPDGALRDQRKIAEFREGGRQARTLVWAPRFFNHQARQELGRLVVIERVLRSDQTFEQASEHLSSADRVQAKSLLRGQLETLRHSIRGYMLAAYGLSSDKAFTKALDDEALVPDQFVSLWPSLDLKLPGTGKLDNGLERLLEQALDHQFPAAPAWSRTFTRAQLEKAREICLKAAGTEGWRATVDSADLRLMREFAEPLRLGRTQSAFVLDTYWQSELDRARRQSGSERAAVGDVLAWMDQPDARGLPKQVGDLIVHVYAAMSELALYREAGPLLDVALGDLRPTDELRPVPMPDEEVWKRAQTVAGAVFGVASDLYRTGANVATLARSVQKLIGESHAAARELYAELQKVPTAYLPADAQRLEDARATVELFDALAEKEPKPAVEALAGFEFEGGTTPESVARSWRQAQAVVGALRGVNWGLFDLLGQKKGHAKVGERAEQLLTGLRSALEHSELVEGLVPVLRSAPVRATDILREAEGSSAADTATTVDADVKYGTTGGSRVLGSKIDLDALAQEFRALLESGETIRVEWKVGGTGGDA